MRLEKGKFTLFQGYFVEFLLPTYAQLSETIFSEAAADGTTGIVPTTGTLFSPVVSAHAGPV